MNDRNFALTSALMPGTATEAGLFKLTKHVTHKIYECQPAPSSNLEFGFSGPSSASFFERVKEGLSRLPSEHTGQVILQRKRCDEPATSDLFPNAGFRTRLFLIEYDKGIPGQSSLAMLLDELGLSPEPLRPSDFLALRMSFFGVGTKATVIPDLVWESDYLKVQNHVLRIASLTDSPNVSWPGFLQALFEGPEEFTASIKFKVPNKAKTKRELETRRRVTHALSVRRSDELADLESGSTLSAAEETLLRITQGKESLFDVSVAVIMHDSDLANLEQRLGSLVSDVTSGSGAGLYIEGVGALPVFKSHLPGLPTLSPRTLKLLSGNFAHCLPLLHDYNRIQDPSPLKLVSRTGEQSNLNLFSKTNLNFNAFICGASGSGKSFLMNSILAAFKEENPDGQVSVFDIGGSYRKLVTHLGGTTSDLSPIEAKNLICSHLKRRKLEASGYFRTLIESLCGADSHITHSHRVAIEDLLQTAEGAPFSIRLLINEAEERSERAYKDLSLWLRPYSEWDDIAPTKESQTALIGQVRAFDFKSLESDPAIQRLTILVLMQDIWERLKTRQATRTLIIFDEVWKFFAQAQGFLEEMYRTFRKYGAGIASVTQNLADYGDEAFAKLVVTNSFNRILLQGAASAEVLESTLDLKKDDVDRFLTIASKKNHYSEFWLGTPSFSQILRLHPSPALFELANSESIQSKKAVNA